MWRKGEWIDIYATGEEGGVVSDSVVGEYLAMPFSSELILGN